MCAARRGGSLVAVCLGGKKRTLTFHSGVCGLRGLRQFYEKLLVHPSDTVNNINNAVNNTVNNIIYFNGAAGRARGRGREAGTFRSTT